MEPLSLISIVESALSLAFKCGSTAKALSDIAAKYKYAELTVMAIIQGLQTIKLSLSRIAEWLQGYALEHKLEDDGFV